MDRSGDFTRLTLFPTKKSHPQQEDGVKSRKLGYLLARYLSKVRQEIFPIYYSTTRTICYQMKQSCSRPSDTTCFSILSFHSTKNTTARRWVEVLAEEQQNRPNSDSPFSCEVPQRRGWPVHSDRIQTGASVRLRHDSPPDLWEWFPQC